MKELVDAIIVMCCLQWNVEPKALLGDSKIRRVFFARTSACILLHRYALMTHEEIAKVLNRERSTVTSCLNNSVRNDVIFHTSILNKKLTKVFPQLKPKQLF